MNAVQEFQQAHGDSLTWGAVDFEVHQNLVQFVQISRKERLYRRPRRRLSALALVAYATPMYVLAEVIHAVRGTAWNRLEHRLDQVDTKLTAVEDAIARAGDQNFGERLGAATDRLLDVVGQVAGRLSHFFA